MEEEIIVPGLCWDKPLYFFNEQPFIPVIYDDWAEVLPQGFNALKIQIDGRLHADLAWKLARHRAQAATEKGYFIFWEIELGLFADMKFPITHQTQHLSLSLSLEHFRDSLWKEFGPQSLGLGIYRGAADFSQQFSWDATQIENLQVWLQERFENIATLNAETQLHLDEFNQAHPDRLGKSIEGQQLLSFFCRDVALEYMALLAGRLPDSLPRYLMLEMPEAIDPLWQAQLLNPECFEVFGLMVKNAKIPLQALRWDESSIFGSIGKIYSPIPTKQDIKIGVCLPPADMCRPSQYAGLQAALTLLVNSHIPFRLIAEDHLITDWDGLDDLFYVPTGLSAQGKRKLQGFCAAGGTVITVGCKLGLAHEMNWNEWLIQTKL
jgi:hypothetical protein